MFERYTERARRVVFFARYEAANAGNPKIEVSHLILGIARENFDAFERVTKIERETLVQAFRLDVPARLKISTSIDLPLERACKQALVFASDEAETMGHKQIGTDHLLLGILRTDSRESRALAQLGITLDAARVAMLSGEPAPTPKPPAMPPATREEVQQLLAELPDDRLPTAALILKSLVRHDFRNFRPR